MPSLSLILREDGARELARQALVRRYRLGGILRLGERAEIGRAFRPRRA
jgi:hypothetical protein